MSSSGSFSSRSPQDLGVGMAVHPILPGGILRFNPRQKLTQVRSVDPSKSAPVRVPQAHRLLIIQYKPSFVGPTRGSQGQDLAVQIAAVHGSQTSQRSISHGYFVAGNGGVGNFVGGELAD